MSKFIFKAIMIVIGLLVLVPLGRLLVWVWQEAFSGFSLDNSACSSAIGIIGIIVIIYSLISLFKD